jgi:hypothetical protein
MVTVQTVEAACVDPGDTGRQPAADAAMQAMQLEVVNLPDAKRGFVLSAGAPHRLVVH